jgi:hypothetical protein
MAGGASMAAVGTRRPGAGEAVTPGPGEAVMPGGAAAQAQRATVMVASQARPAVMAPPGTLVPAGSVGPHLVRPAQRPAVAPQAGMRAAPRRPMLDRAAVARPRRVVARHGDVMAVRGDGVPASCGVRAGIAGDTQDDPAQREQRHQLRCRCRSRRSFGSESSKHWFIGGLRHRGCRC